MLAEKTMKARLESIENWAGLAAQANRSARVLAQKCGVSLRALQRYFLVSQCKSPRCLLHGQRQ
jgi:hypothetical protein